MRVHRLLIAVLAFCLIGLVPFVSGTSATAVAPAASAARQEASAERLAKPRRTVAFEFKELRRGYKFTGKVQDGKRTKVNLMRAEKKKGKYRVVKSGRTNAQGRFEWSGLSKPGWYYAKVPGNNTWATSYSQLIHVFYV